MIRIMTGMQNLNYWQVRAERHRYRLPDRDRDLPESSLCHDRTALAVLYRAGRRGGLGRGLTARLSESSRVSDPPVVTVRVLSQYPSSSVPCRGDRSRRAAARLTSESVAS
jgi:hypothetical protein